MNGFQSFILNLKSNKDKRLSFYGDGEIISSTITLPRQIEELIKQANKDILILIKYLYENFFDEIKVYLGFNQIKKIDFQLFNFFHRYDLFFDKEGGIKVVEFNMDVAGGHIETLIMNDLSISELFLRNFVNGLKKYLKDGNIYIVTSLSYREDYKIALLIKQIIEYFLGRSVKIVSPVQLSFQDCYLYFEDIKIDNLLRYYPWDRFLPLDLKCKTNIINPIQSFLFQQKSLFSFIWKNIENFDATIQRIIKKYIPYSIRLDEIDDLDKFMKDKDNRVLKHVNDREGNNIFIGELTKINERNKLINRALSKPKYYIFQQKVNIVSSLDGYYFNFGVYNVSRNYSGIYLRLHKKIKTDITSNIAYLRFE